MTLAPGMNAARAQYNRDAILSATPARLLTMLYDRLLLDLARAEAAQEAGDWDVATTNLVHAQAIVAELSSALKVDAWDGAQGLLALYTFVSKGLIHANTHRDIASTRMCVTVLEPLRQTWHEAAVQLPASDSVIRVEGSIGVA